MTLPSDKKFNHNHQINNQLTTSTNQNDLINTLRVRSYLTTPPQICNLSGLPATVSRYAHCTGIAPREVAMMPANNGDIGQCTFEVCLSSNLFHREEKQYYQGIHRPLVTQQ